MVSAVRGKGAGGGGAVRSKRVEHVEQARADVGVSDAQDDEAARGEVVIGG